MNETEKNIQELLERVREDDERLVLIIKEILKEQDARIAALLKENRTLDEEHLI